MLGLTREEVVIRERRSDGGLVPYTLRRMRWQHHGMPRLICVNVGSVEEYRTPPDLPGIHTRIRRMLQTIKGAAAYDDNPLHYREGL